MKKLSRLVFILTIAIIYGIAGISCKSSKTSQGVTSDPDVSLIGGTWILKSLNGLKSSDIFKGKTPSMTVDLTNNRVSGNAGCNNYFGAFVYEKGAFSVPKAASTMMACGFDNKETDYLKMIGNANKVLFISGILTFENQGRVVAEFIKGINQDMLSGTWLLESIEGGKLDDLFGKEGRIPTLEFNLQEGRISGNSGCNTYGASFTIEGISLTVGPMMSTRIACPNMEGESKFVQSISETSVLDVTSDRLTISKGGAILLQFAKK